jgi:hypothetical protein
MCHTDAKYLSPKEPNVVCNESGKSVLLDDVPPSVHVTGAEYLVPDHEDERYVVDPPIDSVQMLVQYGKHMKKDATSKTVASTRK